MQINKDAPRVVKVPDTPDATGDVEKFVAELFKSQNYYTVKEIEDDYADRFKGLSESHIKSFKPTKAAHAKPSRKATVSGRVPRKPKENLPPDSKAPRNDGKGGPIRI